MSSPPFTPVTPSSTRPQAVAVDQRQVYKSIRQTSSDIWALDRPRSSRLLSPPSREQVQEKSHRGETLSHRHIFLNDEYGYRQRGSDGDSGYFQDGVRDDSNYRRRGVHNESEIRTKYAPRQLEDVIQLKVPESLLRSQAARDERQQYTGLVRDTFHEPPEHPSDSESSSSSKGYGKQDGRDRHTRYEVKDKDCGTSRPRLATIRRVDQQSEDSGIHMGEPLSGDSGIHIGEPLSGQASPHESTMRGGLSVNTSRTLSLTSELEVHFSFVVVCQRWSEIII